MNPSEPTLRTPLPVPAPAQLWEPPHCPFHDHPRIPSRVCVGGHERDAAGDERAVRPGNPLVERERGHRPATRCAGKRTGSATQAGCHPACQAETALVPPRNRISCEFGLTWRRMSGQRRLGKAWPAYEGEGRLPPETEAKSPACHRRYSTNSIGSASRRSPACKPGKSPLFPCMKSSNGIAGLPDIVTM